MDRLRPRHLRPRLRRTFELLDPEGRTRGIVRMRHIAKDGKSFRKCVDGDVRRSEEHTSELQSLMRISYAVFCLQKKKKKILHHNIHNNQLVANKHYIHY